MSANLFGERFWGYREPGWHKLGIVSDEKLTAVEAAVAANVVDIRYEKRPLFVDIDGNQIATEKVAIVRYPTEYDFSHRILGITSKDYGVVQNLDPARALDPLTETWPVETVGALGEGETAFFTLDAGEVDINGDKVHQYFLLRDTKDGNSGIRLSFTPVRVVCQNTLTAGEHAAVASGNLRHTGNVKGELQWRVDIIKAMQDTQEQVIDDFKLLASTKLTPQSADGLIRKAYPYPRKPGKVQMAEQIRDSREVVNDNIANLMAKAEEAEQRWESAKERIDERRDAARTLYEKFNDEHPHVGGTAWALFNAVVETEDWREAYGKEDANYSLLWGIRAKTKERAFSQALEYAELER